jgi:cytochrome c oxidase subunit 1
MPRRVPDYLASLGLTTPNEVATLGSYIMALGVILFIVDVVASFRRKVPAGDDPWGGYTLEWITTSPPPEHNFHWLPPIRSERPVFDYHHREHPEVEPRA